MKSTNSRLSIARPCPITQYSCHISDNPCIPGGVYGVGEGDRTLVICARALTRVLGGASESSSRRWRNVEDDIGRSGPGRIAHLSLLTVRRQYMAFGAVQGPRTLQVVARGLGLESEVRIFRTKRCERGFGKVMSEWCQAVVFVPARCVTRSRVECAHGGLFIAS